MCNHDCPAGATGFTPESDQKKTSMGFGVMHFKGHFWDSENNDLLIEKNDSLRLDSDFLSWCDRHDGIFWTEQHKHKCMLSVETRKKKKPQTLKKVFELALSYIK